MKKVKKADYERCVKSKEREIHKAIEDYKKFQSEIAPFKRKREIKEEVTAGRWVKTTALISQQSP